MNNKLALIVQFTGVDQLSGSLRNIVGLGRSGAGALRDLQSESRRLKREMEEAARAIATGSGNLTELIDREKELAAALEATNAQMEQQKANLEVDARADAIRQRGEDLVNRGQSNVIAGASIAAPLLLAAKAGADYSSTLVDIQQKADLTDAATDRMGRTILQIAADAQQLPTAVAAAVDTLAGMGLDPRLAIQLAPAISRLGTAYRVDLADGAAAAYANVNNLQVPIGETARAIDIMATSGNLGAFEVRDMARAFPSLTGQMAALGETGLDAVGRLSAALQIARQTTGTSDEAANNIQNLLAKINAPGTIRAFEKNFGVDLPAALARLQAQGYDTFEAIAMVTRDATGGDLSKLGFAFEDMQAQAAIRTLIQNLDEYKRVRDSAMAGGGTVDRAFDQRVMRDANANWQGFMGTVSTLAVTLGTTLLPTLTQVGHYLTVGLQGITAWTHAHPELAGGIMKAVAAFAAMRIGIGLAQIAFGTILGPISTFYRFFAKVNGVSRFTALLSRSAFFVTRGIAIMVRAFGFLRVAAMFMARGLMQAGMMMLANPVILAITLIVVGLAAAGYLIYRHWDTIKAAFARGIAALGQAWNWIKANFMRILPYMGPFGMAASFVINNWGRIKGAFSTGIGYLGQAWGWIKSNFTRLLPMFGPLGFAASFIINNWGRIKGAFSNGLSAIGSMIGRFRTVGSQIVDGLVAGIRAAPGRVWDALKSIVLAGITNIRAFLGIASPSRLFMQMGGFMTDGLAIGLDDGASRPLRSMQRLATGVASGMAVAASPFAVAAQPASGQRTQSAAAPAGNYTFNIYQQAGESAEDLAKRIADILRRGPKPGEGGGSYDDG
ncbi:MAG: phage tail tape measure protein [Pseudomonadota bacterium]